MAQGAKAKAGLTEAYILERVGADGIGGGGGEHGAGACGGSFTPVTRCLH